MKKPPSESDFERYNSASVGGGGEGHNLMEKYAQENLNIHTRGLLRKKVPVMDMISWTKVRTSCGFCFINDLFIFWGGTKTLVVVRSICTVPKKSRYSI